LKIQKIVYLTKYALKINHHSHKKLNLYNYLHCYRFVNAIPFVDDKGYRRCAQAKSVAILAVKIVAQFKAHPFHPDPCLHKDSDLYTTFT